VRQPNFPLIRSVLWTLVLGVALLLPAAASAQEDGILDVKCNIEGASVFVDGELLGEAPILEIVTAGRHSIRVERDAYEIHEQQIDLRPDTTVEIVATLRRIAPGLAIKVDVDSARVILDGVEVGVGSVVIDPTTPGEHQLVVDGGEFGKYEGRITVPAARMTPVEVKLRGSLGSLAVHSDPEGAHVLLDGRDYGLTPTTIDPVKPGSHSVRLSKDGFSDVLQAVVVEPGDAASLDASLVVEGGLLEIKPNPRNGTVFVNGVEIGVGRQVIGPVKPGMYSIRVTASGHTDFIQPAQVDVGSKTRVAARLQAFDYQGPTGGGGGATALKPVHQRPGFWAGIGGGAAAVVAVVVVAAAVSANNKPIDEPRHVPGVDPPAGATWTWTLP
jgi:hypothetical protein